MHRHQLFGLVVASARPLPAPLASGAADLTITEHQGRLPGLIPNEWGYAYAQRADGSVQVSWSDLFDFVVSADGSHIAVHTGAPVGYEATYTYLLSQIISVALLGKNIESLHGSAVAYQDKAFVLLGDCGAGKSTLTAALLRAGARLLTDDLVVISADGSVARGAHRLKLHPETAQELNLPWPTESMADGGGKHVVQLPPECCASRDTALERIYFISANAAAARVEPLSIPDATRELLAATFNPLHTQPPRLSQLLNNAQALAARFGVHKLHVPHSLDRIDETVATILK